MIEISKKGIDLIKKFEGCSLKAYKDANGYSVGYGHFGVSADTVITQAQADEYLKNDIAWVRKAIEKWDSIYHFSQNEIDALASFTYNCGTGSLAQLVGNGTRDRKTISDKFVLYNKSMDKVLSGLTRRRLEEKALFDSGYVSQTVSQNVSRETSNKKTNEEIALEVIRGNWGNGTERKKRLTNAGYDYSAIQKIVNKMMAK